jgi:hypothetical protein
VDTVTDTDMGMVMATGAATMVTATITDGIEGAATIMDGTADAIITTVIGEMRARGLRRAHCATSAVLVRKIGDLPMRNLTWMLIASGTILSVAPASAQSSDSRYPVCMHVTQWGGSTYDDCSFISWDQCTSMTPGLAASCKLNPYYAGGNDGRWGRARNRSRS